MNKCELVDRLVTELGLSPRKMIDYWQNKKIIIPKKHRSVPKRTAKAATAPEPEELVHVIDIPADDKVFCRMKKIIMSKIDVEEKDITPEAKINALGADSLDAVEIIMEYEREFGISFPYDDAEKKFTRIQDAWQYISDQVKS